MILFLRGKAEEKKRRDFSLQKKKKTNKSSHKEGENFNELVTSSTNAHTQHGGKKEQRENSD